MMFCCIQPPWSKKSKRPFDKNYFLMSKLAISSLINTGFSKDNIVCITTSQDHASSLEGSLGIKTKICNAVPDEYLGLLNKIPKKYFFYKPVAYAKAMPEPINDDTLMVMCDVDAIWKKNPRKFLLKKCKEDVWASEGVKLPRRRPNPPKNYTAPGINYKELKEYYYKTGGGAIAHLHMTYGFKKIPEQLLFSNLVAIKPHIYSDLIRTWYEMSTIVVQREDMEKSDQEVLSAAVWHLQLSHARCGGTRKYFRTKFCNFYECYKRSMMPDDYKKLHGRMPK